MNEYEFSELVLTVDTREKDLNRIQIISDYFEKRGGIVVKESLSLCDYHIEGIFREKSINLGIEFKTIQDFATSYGDLPHKLFEACKLYTDVGLFVEENNISISVNDKGAWVHNPAVQDGSADVLNYYAYKNFLNSMARDGIVTRTFQTSVFFPEDMYAVLIDITKDNHSGLHIKTPDFHSAMMNVLCKMPGVGAKNAEKLLEYFPNLHWLGSEDVTKFQDVLGKVNGKKLFEFIRGDSNEVYKCQENYNALLDKLEGKTFEKVKKQKSPLQSSGDTKESHTHKDASSSELQNPIVIHDNSEVPDDIRYKGDYHEVDKSKFPDPPDEFSMSLTPNKILDYLRRQPRTDADIRKYFAGFNIEALFTVLQDLQRQGKAHYANKAWHFGRDISPVPPKADVEMNVGV